MQNAEHFEKVSIKPVECFKQGYEVIKSDYWLLFAVILLGIMIGGMTLYILLGAMLCGIYLCFLAKIDGKPVSLDLLWKGFEFIAPSLLVTAFIVVPVIVLYLGIYGQLVAAIIFGQNLPPDKIMAILFGSLAFDAVAMIIMVCFHTLLIFSFHLIIDRRLSGWAAMKTSAKAVWANLSGIAGLFGVGFLLTLAGALVCGFGAYFTIPIVFAGYTVAYRKIFPALNQNFNPPSPEFYQNI